MGVLIALGILVCMPYGIICHSDLPGPPGPKLLEKAPLQVPGNWGLR